MKNIAEKEVVHAEGLHFYYESGEKYLPFGTTVYALMYQSEERIEQTVQSIKEAHFNKIRMCVFPKYLVYNLEDPQWFPFEKKEKGGTLTHLVRYFGIGWIC